MGATRLRNFRIPDDEYDPAKAKAATRGETVTDVVRRALVEYVRPVHDPTCPHFDAASLSACPNTKEET
ncbi:MAG: hypothetical protein M0Z51_16825 [Propionibacterium sp.]|nr:hypothetical protein [Propionibacterium sp.]